MNKKGFTIIELLIVIGIIMLLAIGLFIAVNPTTKLAEARDNQRETHLHVINRAVKEKIAKDGWEGCPALPETPTTVSSSDYDLYDCLYPEYLSSPVYDPQTGNFSSTSDYDTGYQIAMNSVDYTYLEADGETREVSLGNEPTFACGSDLTDDRDGQTYTTVEIGTQCWMAENLNIGSMLSSGSDNLSDNGVIEKWCYDNSSSNCDTYGGLYNWHEMMQYVTTEPNQGICPNGWHIPTDDEWYTLENYLTDDGNTCSATRDGDDCDPAGGALKEAGTTHWETETCGTTTCNSSGFNALPGGLRGYTGGFNLMSSYSLFWSSSSEETNDHIRRYLKGNSSEINRSNYAQDAGYSVRCLKD